MKRKNYYRTVEQINDAIVTILEDYGEKSFLDLQKTLCDYGWDITRETLNDYLDKLAENDIIERDEFKSGIRRFSRLSELTRIQKKIGIYTPLKSEKELQKIRNDVDKIV